MQDFGRGTSERARDGGNDDIEHNILGIDAIRLHGPASFAAACRVRRPRVDAPRLGFFIHYELKRLLSRTAESPADTAKMHHEVPASAATFFAGSMQAWHVAWVPIRKLSSIELITLASLLLSPIGCDDTQGASPDQSARTRAAGIAAPTPTASAVAPKSDGAPTLRGSADDRADKSELPQATTGQDPDDDKDDEATNGAIRRVAKRTPSAPGRRRASADDQSDKVAGDGSRPSSDLSAHGAEPAAEVGIKRLIIARSIEDREPVDVQALWDLHEAKEVYAFVEVENPARTKSKVAVRFTAPDGTSFDIHLNVGPAIRWRTWAMSKKVTQPGRWTASVVSPSGDALETTSFTVNDE